MHSRSDSSRRARWFRTERGVACVNQAVGTEYASSKYRKYVGKQLVWHWMGHEIHYRKAGNGPPMILLHGFGVSLESKLYRLVSDSGCATHQNLAAVINGIVSNARILAAS